ncbi:MAG: TldD/PmbA family protein [Candidatus Heimdallarchaeota archaeon]|nr:TldD/PmbA family protein [Candidatus Heimdallarchaeota archaeon]
MSLVDRGRIILDTLNPSDVQFADIRYYSSNELNIVAHKAQIEKIQSTELEGTAIRALYNGAWGFASVASHENAEVKEALKTAIKMAKFTSTKIKRKAIIDNDVAFEGKNEFKPDINPNDLSLDEKVELTRNAEKLLRLHDDRIIDSSVRYTEKVQHERIVNTNGTILMTNDLGKFSLSSTATARSGDIIQEVWDSTTTNAGLKKILDLNLEEQMTDLGARAIKLLDSVPSPSGRLNVVLDPSIVGVYIHEAFGHAAEGDDIVAGRSVLAGKIGKELAHPKVSVYDDPSIEGLFGSYKYDSEGTPTRKRVIIEDGILEGYLHDLSSAAMLGEGHSPNAAGRAADFRHMSMPRMGNTYIGNGEMTFDELLEVAKDGVYLQHSMGGYVDPTIGEFFFTSQSGFMIENGELTKPIRNSGMSGLTLEVLRNTIGVGNDLRLDAFSGHCGKSNLTGYQPMQVSGGGPHLVAKDIVVGGRK